MTTMEVDEACDVAPDTRELKVVKGAYLTHPLGDESVVFGESVPDRCTCAIGMQHKRSFRVDMHELLDTRVRACEWACMLSSRNESS